MPMYKNYAKIYLKKAILQSLHQRLGHNLVWFYLNGASFVGFGIQKNEANSKGKRQDERMKANMADMLRELFFTRNISCIIFCAKDFPSIAIRKKM